MKTVMAKSSEEMSSKRQFHWTNKVTTNEDEEPPALKPSANTPPENEKQPTSEPPAATSSSAALSTQRKKLQAIAVSRLRSVVLTVLNKHRSNSPQSLGHRVIGTLFGNRRGHVQFAFQRDPNSQPAFLVELATPISGLVKEMASGLVRIALECDRELEEEKKKGGGGGGGGVLCRRLLEEPLWRTYCNGKKCGFATRRECGEKDWKVLKAVEPISMGAGVLPAAKGDDHNQGDGGEEEVMYMRAKFERVVGSRDSEAFYMMNPDSNGAPELSIYLLRV